jgi:hypothetical protein
MVSRFKYISLCLCLCFCSTLADAGDWVCGDTTKLDRFTASVDATKVPACPAPFLLSEIPEAQIPAQRTLYASLPPRHIKVVDGLMVEMTQAEKDAVDAPLLLEEAAVEQAKEELNTQEYCATKTLEQITTKMTNKGQQIKANIDAITNLQTGKDADTANFTIVMQLIEQLARCVRAARTSRG